MAQARVIEANSRTEGGRGGVDGCGCDGLIEPQKRVAAGHMWVSGGGVRCAAEQAESAAEWVTEECTSKSL